MKNRSHNKKRNVGIIYEQLINHMCQCVIKNDEKGILKSKGIIKENFKKESQLHRELKFFNALIQTRGIDASLATSIIQEAKKACQKHFSDEILEREKSHLIKELNYSFGKGNIFENKIKNYKILATVQTLLNEWRKGTQSDFQITTEYEKQLHEWMTSKEPEVIVEETNLVPADVDELTFRLMNEKFNKKYDKLLNNDQKRIIKLFVESKSLENEQELIDTFEEIKLKTTKLLESYHCDNQILSERYDIVKSKIKKINTNELSEENVKKFLTLCKLNEELKGEEK
jgi:hypothetical protein